MVRYDTEGRLLLTLIQQRHYDLRHSCRASGRDRPLPGQQRSLTRRALLVVADGLISLGCRIRAHSGRPVSAKAAWSG